MKIALTYTLLAIIATISNLLAQDLAIRVYDGAFAIPLSIFFGTAVGLVLKYFLDKRYIFGFTAKNAAHDRQTFLLYTAVGGITTLVFWGVEWAFHLMFETKEMRYVGGALGLAIGYLAKYHLDKRFVFIKNEEDVS